MGTRQAYGRSTVAGKLILMGPVIQAGKNRRRTLYLEYLLKGMSSNYFALSVERIKPFVAALIQNQGTVSAKIIHPKSSWSKTNFRSVPSASLSSQSRYL